MIRFGVQEFSVGIKELRTAMINSVLKNRYNKYKL